MKKALFIISLIIPTIGLSQDLSDLIGRVYNEKNELQELRSFIQIDARVDLDRYVCSHYLDTLSNERIFIIEKEIKNDSVNTYQIIDTIRISAQEESSSVVIGSYEGVKEKENYRFIIAIECCYDHLNPIPNESKKIMRIWTFSTQLGKLIELKGGDFKRYGEGYYEQ